jgi:hypothetical protein
VTAFPRGIWRYFEEFCGQDSLGSSSSRGDMLLSVLNRTALRHSLDCVEVAGGRHIIVNGGGRGGGQSANGGVNTPVTMLAAHYDRTPGSPGANDNGAAVFMLIETAVRLVEEAAAGWSVVFTDKEELGADGKLLQQGSYNLATALKKAPLGQAGGFFIFDACGRGDTLVISTTAERFLKSASGEKAARMEKAVTTMRTRALEAAGKAGVSRVMLLPTPFSDDAGFLRAGVAAQTITVLPREEVALFTQAARANPLNKHALVNKRAEQAAEQAAERAGKPFYRPETWRFLNGPSDTVNTLTPAFFSQTEAFALALIR